MRRLLRDRVPSSSHNGAVKMWDARNVSCIATGAKCPTAVLCMQFDDTTGILATASRDSAVHI